MSLDEKKQLVLLYLAVAGKTSYKNYIIDKVFTPEGEYWVSQLFIKK